MPCHIAVLTIDGVEPVESAARSLAEAARDEPHDGVYTITNTFNTFEVLKLDAHFDRLEDSARRANIALTLDRARVRSALRDMIAAAGWGDSRFRVTVPRARPDRVMLSIEPFQPLEPLLIAAGVRVVTIAGSERENPAAKTTDWMHDRTTIEATLSDGVYTGLLLGENGAILEGLSSNFYALIDGELRTAGAGMLPGIAQQIVFEIAPEVIPVRRDAPRIADIPRTSEAFITSSSRGIVPVVEIDGVRLGEGAPGVVTLALRERYAAWLAAHLEPL